jgi:hypothetical protein
MSSKSVLHKMQGIEDKGELFVYKAGYIYIYSKERTSELERLLISECRIDTFVKSNWRAPIICLETSSTLS